MSEKTRRNRRVPVTAVVVAVAWAWLAGDAARGESAEELVARSIEFHGGKAYEGREISFRICSKSGCYDVTTEVDEGLFSHRVTGPHGRTVRATNDALTMWVGGDRVPVPAGEEQRWRDWVNARIYFALLPYRLQDSSVRLRDLGTEDWWGHSLRKVEVTFEPGSSTEADDVFLYWFDPRSARLVQFAYSYDGDPDGLRFRELFEYRRVDGILFSPWLAPHLHFNVLLDGVPTDPWAAEGETSLWNEHNAPTPSHGEDDVPPTSWSEEAIDRCTQSCRDPEMRRELESLPLPARARALDPSFDLEPHRDDVWEFVAFDARLRDGDEVAFIPPVSGGSNGMRIYYFILDFQPVLYKIIKFRVPTITNCFQDPDDHIIILRASVSCIMDDLSKAVLNAKDL